MKKLLYLGVALFFVVACNNESTSDQSSDTTTITNTDATAEEEEEARAKYDQEVGTGKYTEENFQVSEVVDKDLAKKGDAIYSAKCQSCHKTTNEQLVGPGFAGVSERRTPVWIMNFLTNTDEMIDLDPALQEQLELCMVRMPDQALSETDAHSFVEFFRANDMKN